MQISYGVTTAQTYAKNEFKSFSDSFPEVRMPFSYKFSEKTQSFDKTISDPFAKKYLGLKDEDLKYNEVLYDMDEDKSYDNWVKTSPYYYGKFTKGNIVALAYAIDYYTGESVEVRTYKAVLCTFNGKGERLDSLVVEQQLTYEEDCLAVVFLKNDRFLLFDYKVNMENLDIPKFKKTNSYYWLDEKKPKTVADVYECRIDEYGKIKKTAMAKKHYLKNTVEYYRTDRPDSDDPMREYVK